MHTSMSFVCVYNLLHNYLVIFVLAYLRQAQKHCKLVSGVFGGKFVNIIICRECNSVSVVDKTVLELVFV